MKINILLLSIFALTSCQTARELHYFKQGDNYYRLKIKEHSFASRSRYLSGYFNEQAVEKYFSETGHPDSAKVSKWQPIKGDQKGTLVMILSSNSNSISEQIGNMAGNEELLETIARLSHKDKIEKTSQLTSDIDNLKSIRNGLINAGDTYLGKLDATNLTSTIHDLMLSIEAQTQSKLQISNINEAKK
jgi:hypothetical protein